MIHATTIDIPKPVMMHDFAITKNYSIFMDLPLIFSSGLKWQPENGARVGILPRKADGSKIRWFTITPGWVYHTVNAFEDSSKVILVGCRRQSWPKSPSLLHQWTFDLVRGSVSEKQLDDTNSEFPTLNPAVVGRNSNFGYAAALGSEEGDAILKYDFKKGSSEKFVFGPGRHGGETSFIPAGKPSSEDNGFLINLVYDKTSSTSEAVILRADHLKRPPLARIVLPRRVPYDYMDYGFQESNANSRKRPSAVDFIE